MPTYNNKHIDIVHECADQPVNGVSKMDTNLFKSNRVGFWHLSSTPIPSHNNHYIVSFWSGIIGTHQESSYAVRLVRATHKISDKKLGDLFTPAVKEVKTRLERERKANEEACKSRYVGERLRLEAPYIVPSFIFFSETKYDYLPFKVVGVGKDRMTVEAVYDGGIISQISSANIACNATKVD